MIRQPLPCAASGSLSNGVNVHVPQAGFFGYIFTRMIGPAKLADLIFGEPDFSMFFASIRCAVLDAIHRVFRATSPINVLPIYAFSIAAAMRRIPASLWAFSVNLFANQTMHPMFDAVDANTGVAALIGRKRPRYAFVGVHLDRGFDEFSGAEIFPIRHSVEHTHCSSVVNGRVPFLF